MTVVIRVGDVQVLMHNGDYAVSGPIVWTGQPPESAASVLKTAGMIGDYAKYQKTKEHAMKTAMDSFTTWALQGMPTGGGVVGMDFGTEEKTVVAHMGPECLMP